MRQVHHSKSTSHSSERPTLVDDGFLIAGIRGGDEAALRKLIERYDRLVRLTVFRASTKIAASDPQWVDSIASATWAGLVRSLRSDPTQTPDALPAYLVRIARNQVVSALRRLRPSEASADVVDVAESANEVGDSLTPSNLAENAELLGLLRECFSLLDRADQRLTSQLPAIMDRKWERAADILGLSESTLRSQWKRTLEKLRLCLERKSGSRFAPGPGHGD